MGATGPARGRSARIMRRGCSRNAGGRRVEPTTEVYAPNDLGSRFGVRRKLELSFSYFEDDRLAPVRISVEVGWRSGLANPLARKGHIDSRPAAVLEFPQSRRVERDHSNPGGALLATQSGKPGTDAPRAGPNCSKASSLHARQVPPGVRCARRSGKVAKSACH